MGFWFLVSSQWHLVSACVCYSLEPFPCSVFNGEMEFWMANEEDESDGNWVSFFVAFS